MSALSRWAAVAAIAMRLGYECMEGRRWRMQTDVDDEGRLEDVGCNAGGDKMTVEFGASFGGAGGQQRRHLGVC